MTTVSFTCSQDCICSFVFGSRKRHALHRVRVVGGCLRSRVVCLWCTLQLLRFRLQLFAPRPSVGSSLSFYVLFSLRLLRLRVS